MTTHNNEYQEKLFTASCHALSGILANSYDNQHSNEATEEAIEITEKLLNKLGYERCKGVNKTD